MPLAFPSLNHGTIVFGFYNIETDSLLLEEQVFFCTDFCVAARTLADGGNAKAVMPGHVFAEPKAMGDLMGAIRGERHLGYLGDIYRLWPFPARPEDFRQKLDGHLRRTMTEEVLDRHAVRVPIVMERNMAEEVLIGSYIFSTEQFLALVRYVRRGGHPTWDGFAERGACPEHVRELALAYGLGA